MTLPTDTNHFDPIVGGAADNAATFNLVLSQLSGAISALTSLLDTAQTVTYGTALAARDAVYLNPADSKVYKLDADDPTAISSIRGFVETAGATDATGKFLVSGILEGFTGLTPFARVYADSAVPGALTHTRPAATLDGAQMAVIDMGYAISATQIVIAPQAITYFKRANLADEETLTIQHIDDPLDYKRQIRALSHSTVAGATLTEYSSGNQDSDVPIKGTAGAGAVTNSGTQSGSDGYIGDNGGTEYRTAQSFQMTALGALSQFTFTLNANSGTPSGDLGWEIRDDNSGDPGATVLASGSIANASVLASLQNTVNISNGPILQSSTTYWLVLYSSVDEASNSSWNWQLSLTGTYGSGSRSYSTNGGSSWINQAALDCTFTVTTSAVVANDKLAQGVQVATSDVFTVQLYLRKVGAPTGNLTVKIETDAAGDPSATPVTNGTSNTVAASSLSASYALIEFTFATAPSLSASTQYHLVLESSDTASNTDYVQWGADGSSPTYADGEMKHEQAAVWASENKDAIFAVIAPGPPIVSDLLYDEWTSSSTRLVNRYGDVSGNNLDTETTFKCVDVAGIADVTVQVTL